MARQLPLGSSAGRARDIQNRYGNPFPAIRPMVSATFQMCRSLRKRSLGTLLCLLLVRSRLFFRWVCPCTGTPDSWSGGGGTSFTAPIMAGIQALVNQKSHEEGRATPPLYYRLSAAHPTVCSSSVFVPAACIFYDIPDGDIDVNCTGAINCFYGTPSVGPNGVLSTASSANQPAFTAGLGDLPRASAASMPTIWRSIGRRASCRIAARRKVQPFSPPSPLLLSW